MDHILNKNQNKKHLIAENTDNLYNYDDAPIFIARKRRKPDGGDKEHVNELNSEINLQIDLLKQKLEENEIKEKDLKNEIIQKNKKLNNISEEIKNIKNELDVLEKYKKIKKI